MSPSHGAFLGFLAGPPSAALAVSGRARGILDFLAASSAFRSRSRLSLSRSPPGAAETGRALSPLASFVTASLSFSLVGPVFSSVSPLTMFRFAPPPRTPPSSTALTCAANLSEHADSSALGA